MSIVVSSQPCPMLTLFHPRHPRGAVAVGGGVAGGDVVGARQVVVRQGLQVENVVVTFFGANPPRGLVERAANKKMGARENPLLRTFGEPSTSFDNSVFISIGFVPHFQ